MTFASSPFQSNLDLLKVDQPTPAMALDLEHP